MDNTSYQTIGAFGAKTHFSQLLAEVVDTGESIVITKQGKKVATLVPYNRFSEPDLTIAAIHTIRQNRKKTTLGSKLSIKSLIAEGRK